MDKRRIHSRNKKGRRAAVKGAAPPRKEDPALIAGER